MDTKRMILLPFGPDIRPYPGSVVIVSSCGHRCWISPAGQQELAGDPFTWETRCLECIDPEDIDTIDEIPGSRDEMERILGGPERYVAMKDLMERLLRMGAFRRRNR